MSDIEERVAAALVFLPEPFVIRRGTSAGTGPEGVVWGDPEPGSYTNEQRAESFLALLAADGLTIVPTALVEAALEWRDECYSPTLDQHPDVLATAIDAYREATR